MRLNRSPLACRWLARGGRLAAIAVAGSLAACAGGSTPAATVGGASTVGSGSGSSVAVAGGLRNVQISSDRFSGHVEPDLAVNPTNSRNVLVASQITVRPHLIVPGTYASSDGGRIWRANGPLPMPNGFPGGADTTVAFDARGIGYVVSLASDRAGGGYPSRTRAGEILLWRTTDGGRSFAGPTVAYRGAGFQDHPWLAIDTSQPSQPLFVAWGNQQGLEFAVSRDGGRHFGAARILVVSQNALGWTPVVLAGNGRVYVLYQEIGSSSITIECLRSQDDGMTFEGPVSVGTASETTLAGEVSKEQAGPPPLFSAATDAAGMTVYAAISESEPSSGHPIGVVWRSRNAGQSWNGPVDAATGRDSSLSQTQPRLAVGPSGVLYVLYLVTDRRGLIGVRLSHSADGGRRFGGGRWISNRLFSANRWLSQYHGWFGDYQALRVGSGALRAVWNDDRTGDVQLVTAELPVG
jgi:hypothetical protein